MLRIKHTLIIMMSRCCQASSGTLYLKLVSLNIIDSWTDYVLASVFSLLSVTFIGLYKHTSLLQNLYIMNLYCYIIQGAGVTVMMKLGLVSTILQLLLFAKKGLKKFCVNGLT